MKLVLIADTFPPLRTSGAVQLRDLTRELVQQGHEITVLLPDAGLDKPWQLDALDGAEVLRLKAPRTKDVNFLRRTLSEWLMPLFMRRNLGRSPLKARRWDGVAWYSPSIFHAPLVRSIKRRSECPGYLIVRDIFPEWAVDLGLMKVGLAYRFFSFIARQQYKVADVIGVQTAGNLAYFERWRKSGPGRSLEVLPNWLGATARVRSTIRIEETALSGRRILVYAGNMGVAQGMDMLIDLADGLKFRRDIGFLFVGRGSDTQRIKELARSKCLDNVLFFDEIDPDEIPALYAQCHAGMLSLDHRHRSHNIPGKFLTYVQNGLPVLANVNPGNDLVALINREGVGEVCQTNRLQELLERCESLIEQIGNDDEIKKRCKDLFARDFSVNKVAEKITKSIEAAKMELIRRTNK